MKILKLDEQGLQTLNLLVVYWKRLPLSFDEHAAMQQRVNILFGKIEDDKNNAPIEGKKEEA